MMNSRKPLAGRVALVTGAGPGLGRALARALAEAGANLVVCDINEASLAEARAAVEETRAHQARSAAVRTAVGAAWSSNSPPQPRRTWTKRAAAEFSRIG